MKVHLTTHVDRLQFRFPFRIAHGTRTGTDVVFIRLQCDGHVAFGEATLPPYLDDNLETVQNFFRYVLSMGISYPFHPGEIFDEIDMLYPGCMPGKAALDMALWKLKADIEGKIISDYFQGLSAGESPHTYTIGVGSRSEMLKKLTYGKDHGFTFFKLKLDGISDHVVVRDYLDLCSLPFAVDANQGWTDLNKAIEFSRYLEGVGCVLIEQPFEKEDRTKSEKLADEIEIPILADEACQRLSDIESLSGSFDGINIKIQKCGGITEAFRMIKEARSRSMKILIGCMSESSIGCEAAEILAPLCDWADLDGPFLNDNNNEILSRLVEMPSQR